MYLIIIIPAYNEALRIGKTLTAYTQFFNEISNQYNITYRLLVVLNGCTDNTYDVVAEHAKRESAITMLVSPSAGKGLALRHGFIEALAMKADLIGFVDADMATRPVYFYDLVQGIGKHGVAVASRYMPGAHVFPARPWYKELGRTMIYNNIVRLLFHMNLHDYQCGAKLFTYDVVKKIAPRLTVAQWACDIEMLYEAVQTGHTIVEIPTTWHDQDGSKFHSLGSGIAMIKTLIQLWWQKKRNQ